MAKISNQNAYPLINPTLEDYVVITDKENALLTKTTKLRNIQSLFELQPSSFNISIQGIQGTPGINLPTYGNPVELIPAPGPDKVLRVNSIFFYIKAGSIPYDYGTAVYFDIGTWSATNQGVSLTSIQSYELNTTVDFCEQENLDYKKSPEINAPLKLYVRTAGNDPTQGNSILKINVIYDIIDLTLFD